ncbi:MAG: tyrosine--tRNA ligase [Chlamydiota bacterium]|nr:tyrosine--tRNA ligase [Chlamydiota bacterium]
MANVIDVLRERGFIDSVTNEEIRNLSDAPLSVYCGFDPTSDSLHLGNLVSIMGLAWFQRCGHTPVAIVGGATGMIGDPSGKSHERNLLDEDALKVNLAGITENLKTILDFDAENKPVILNNYDWYKNFPMIDFLRSVGKHFRIGTMLAKDSVKGRFESEEGMSFTEFSYQLLQGYDFLHLYREHGVTVQLGGSDQWGNITAGTDLVRKVTGDSVSGVTFPLLTRSDGKKFGKSEKGAIWLSSDKLSPYEFYQYLIRITDEDVIKLMRMLTFMEMDEIRHYEKLMQEASYIPNTAQKRLAEEVTRLVHGEEGLSRAVKATKGAAPGSDTKLDAETLEMIASDMPSKNLQKDDVIGSTVVEVIVKAEIQPSKGAAKRMVEGGGVYLNNKKVADVRTSIEEADLIEGRLLLLAVGKKNKVLIRLQ